MKVICDLRIKNPNNPLIGYLNINSLRNKVVDLREILSKISPDYFVVAETKLDYSIPSKQLEIENYEIRNRKDRDKNGGGLIEYVKKGVVCKQLNFDAKSSEIIISELTIRNKKWVIISCYRPPSNTNLITFFNDLENCLNKAFSKVDNVIVLGDLSINFNVTDSNYDRLKILCETFDLRNIIKQKTCFAGEQGTLIDLILTNRPRSFKNTVATETGLSDHHLMISTFLKAYLVRLKPKNIFYRNYKNFDPSQFLDDMKNAQFTCYTEDPNLNYENLVNTFK